MKSSNIMLILTILIISMCSICLAQNSPQDFLDVHNEARAEIGIPPPSWNKTIAKYAQKYANSRIKDCEMEHSMGPYGENLAVGFGEFKGSDAVKFWLTEKPNYDHKSNTCINDECYHYIQIIWKDTVHFGCAKAKCDNGWMFIICNYDPPANILASKSS